MSMQSIVPESRELPEELANTDVHIIQGNLGLVGSQLKMVPDLIAGGERSKRYGVWLSMNVLPFLDKQIIHKDQPLILPDPPAVLIVADTLEEIRKRVIHEVDVMLETAQKIVDGEIDLDEYADEIEQKVADAHKS